MSKEKWESCYRVIHVKDEPAKMIATLKGHDYWKATLMSAAPELLEVCQRISEWATKEMLPVGRPQDGPWIELDVAIAKAKGVS